MDLHPTGHELKGPRHGLAGLVAAFVRLRGCGGTPPQTGGWHECCGRTEVGRPRSPGVPR